MQKRKVERTHFNQDRTWAFESSRVQSFLICWANTFIYLLLKLVCVRILPLPTKMSLYFQQVFMNFFPIYVWTLKKNTFSFISLLGKCAATVLKVQSVQYSRNSENSPPPLNCLKLFTSFARISIPYILIIFSQNL